MFQQSLEGLGSTSFLYMVSLLITGITPAPPTGSTYVSEYTPCYVNLQCHIYFQAEYMQSYTMP